MEGQRFVVLVPVKSPDVGKSRLLVPDRFRPALATAFALDTLRAACAATTVAEVVVVTDDRPFAETATGLGLRTVPDEGDLNRSLVSAAQHMRRSRPEARPVALCADLPCLVPEDLDRALDSVAGEAAHVVSDSAGTGTTTYVASYDGFSPAFGDGSRGVHLSAGAREITGTLATLRHDVDDEAALAVAIRIGLGPHTRQALESFRSAS